jgi:hypothetical protein
LKRITNRLNAQKSTGPKTEAGKYRAARNALRHGMTATPPPGSISEVFAEIAGDDASLPFPGDSDDKLQVALRLATAEVRLRQVIDAERQKLAEGGFVGLLDDTVDRILDLIDPDDPLNGPTTERDLKQAMRLVTRAQRLDRVAGRRTYALMLRYRQEAMLLRSRALRNWLAESERTEGISGEPETKPS